MTQSIDYTDWYGEGNEPDEAERASYRDDVINCIGNMALLPVCDNSKASNKDFQTKKEIYVNGSKRKKDFGIPYDTHWLIKDVVDHYTFLDKSSVFLRAEMFADRAKRIWKKTSTE